MGYTTSATAIKEFTEEQLDKFLDRIVRERHTEIRNLAKEHRVIYYNHHAIYRRYQAHDYILRNRAYFAPQYDSALPTPRSNDYTCFTFHTKPDVLQFLSETIHKPEFNRLIFFAFVLNFDKCLSIADNFMNVTYRDFFDLYYRDCYRLSSFLSPDGKVSWIFLFHRKDTI